MMKEKMLEMISHLRNAKNNEEVKQIIEDSRSVLTDDDLDQISGGLPTYNFYCNSMKC